jgi:hypothetical protein
MAERKERMSLLSRYAKLHTARYGERPTHNLNSEQWSADNLIESYGLTVCYDLLQHYFEASDGSFSWRYFVNYAEKIFDAKIRVEQDQKEREERRKLARAWLNE